MRIVKNITKKDLELFDKKLNQSDMKKLKTSLKYIDLQRFINECFIKYSVKGNTLTRRQMEEIFKFQFYMMREKMKQKDYIKLPKIGVFKVKTWTDVLERERILFGVKNVKSDYEKDPTTGKVKTVTKLKAYHINHNFLIYNDVRNNYHKDFYNIEVYEKEMLEAYELNKHLIISVEMIDKARVCVETNEKLKELIYSTRDKADKWFTSAFDRRQKIDHHYVEGYITKKDKYKEFLKDESNRRRT